MSLNRLTAWFATDIGKKVSYLAAGTVSTAVLVGHIVPQTILLDKYAEIVHLYRNGFTVPLTPLLTERFNKALELTEVDPIDRDRYRPFAVYGFDVCSAGYHYSKYGVVVGVPANFFYTDPKTIDKTIIKLRDDPIFWDTDEGQLLLKSLVLSENAQIYGMAREIKFRQTPKLVIDTLISTVSVAGAYGLGHSFNRKLNLFAKPLSVRVILYCIVGAFSAGSWAMGKDASQIYFEAKIDRELKEKNPVFVEGGREFYTKLIQRNIALRTLLGRAGERAYSVMGNENYFIRYKHIPLVQRKQMFDVVA